jgi:DNA primase catalytic core
MARIPEDEIDSLKRRIDLLALVESKGVRFRRRGSQYVARCPLHEEKSASFTVTPAKRLWHCFGCNQGGDAIRFIELSEGVSFRDAVDRLARLNGAIVGHASTRTAARAARAPASRAKLLARVVAFYARRFLDSPEGLRYLTKERGICDVALLKTFQVGYADGTLLEALPQDEGAIAELKALGLLTERGRELFSGCVVFPLWSEQGAIMNLYGRRTSDGEVNHLYLPGPRQGLWNWQAAKRSKAILLTESVIDALSAIDAGVHDAIPCYGVHGLLEEHLALFTRYGVERVAIAFDADAAGRSGAGEVAERLKEKGIDARLLELPEGEDVNSYLTGTQADEHQARFKAMIESALAAKPAAVAVTLPAPASSLAADTATETPPAPTHGYTPTAHGFKVSFSARLYEVKGIAREPTQLKATVKASGERAKGFELTTLDLYSQRSREAYARACASLFGVEATLIKADLAQLLDRVEAWQPGAAKVEPPPEPTAAEREAAESFLRNPELFAELRADLATLGVAGEDENKVLYYVAAVSRKLDDPLSLLLHARSAAGKSTLQNAVLELVPDEDKAVYTRLTSQALFYQAEHALAHKVLALEEAQGLGEAAYSLRALQSAKRIRVATTVKDPVTGKLRTDSTTVQGPVAVLLTTAKPDLDEETSSRFLALAIDESRAMTETILRAQRHRDTLEGYLAELDQQAVIAKHHTAQRLLEPLVVLNPYAEQLTFPTQSLRARRDNKKYLMLIKAIAFLHQKQRPIKEGARAGARFRYIEATKEDVARANALASQVLRASLDELSAPARQLLRHTRAMVKAYCEAHELSASQYVFTRKAIREATGWSDWQVRMHLKELEDLEYLKARSGTWGREYVYELAWDGEEQRLTLPLVDPERLVEP